MLLVIPLASPSLPNIHVSMFMSADLQDEVQERARNAELKAAQKALAKEASPASQNRTSSISDDYEKPTTDSANGLPSLPYKDLPPLEPPPESPTPSSDLGSPDL